MISNVSTYTIDPEALQTQWAVKLDGSGSICTIETFDNAQTGREQRLEQGFANYAEFERHVDRRGIVMPKDFLKALQRSERTGNTAEIYNYFGWEFTLDDVLAMPQPVRYSVSYRQNDQTVYHASATSIAESHKLHQGWRTRQPGSALTITLGTQLLHSEVGKGANADADLFDRPLYKQLQYRERHMTRPNKTNTRTTPSAERTDSLPHRPKERPAMDFPAPDPRDLAAAVRFASALADAPQIIPKRAQINMEAAIADLQARENGMAATAAQAAYAQFDRLEAHALFDQRAETLQFPGATVVPFADVRYGKGFLGVPNARDAAKAIAACAAFQSPIVVIPVRDAALSVETALQGLAPRVATTDSDALESERDAVRALLNPNNYAPDTLKGTWFEPSLEPAQLCAAFDPSRTQTQWETAIDAHLASRGDQQQADRQGQRHASNAQGLTA